MQNSSVEDTHFNRNLLKFNGNLIDLSLPRIMGILNVTEDSFYSGSRLKSDLELIERAKTMLEQGATFLDIGGYSTRPGAQPVDIKTETSNISSASKILRSEFPDVLLSIDTFNSSVAQAGIDNGACLINDISGGRFDNNLLSTVAQNKVAYIIMHSQGNIQTMHSNYTYDSIIKEVNSYFNDKVNECLELGINDIIIDPGYGFSKSIEQNYELLKHQDQLLLHNRPILAGISRKSMIYKKLNCTPQEALNGTTSLNTVALLKGASILRVHDVKPAMEVIRLLI